MTDLKQAMYNSLEDLGSTAYEVANSLRKQEIRGYRILGDKCPLACYLQKEFSRKDISVSTDMFGYGFLDETFMPQACRDFVREFDIAEQFSDLAIEEET